MARVKQASKQKRTTKAATVKALGAAGLGLSLANSASASAMPAVDSPQFDNTSTNQRFVLGEEEMADVSLATFHLFDRENFGSGVQVARGGCGGCGCGHGGGCGGCGHGGGCGGVRGCGGGGCVGIRGCGGAGFVGVRACGGAGFVGVRSCGGGFVGVRACGGFRACAFRGCAGFRGCGCGGCGFGVWVVDDTWSDDWGFGGWGVGACCASWGACRFC